MTRADIPATTTPIRRTNRALLIPKTYRLHPEEYAWLIQEAARRGYSVAFILRGMIRQAMRRKTS